MTRLFFSHINQRNEWILSTQIFLSICLLFSIGILFDVLHLAIFAVLGAVCATLAQLQSHHICANTWQRSITLGCFLLAMVLSTSFFFTSPVLLILYFCVSTLVLIFVSSSLGGRFTGLGFTTILASIYMIWGIRVLGQPLFLASAFLSGACVFYLVNRLWAELNAKYSQHAALAQCYVHFEQLFEDLTRRLERSDKEQYMLLQQQCQTYTQLSQKLEDAELLITPVQTPEASHQARYIAICTQTRALQELAFCLMSKTAFDTCKQHTELAVQQLRALAMQCKTIAAHLKSNKYPDNSTKTSFDDATTPLPCLRSCVRKLNRIEMLLFTDTEYALSNKDASLMQTTHAYPWHKIKSNLHLKSPSMRYALRLAIGLSLCLGIAFASPWPNHEWLLITFWLVCRPSYGATRQRLLERTAGTFFGLAFSVPLVSLFSEALYLQVLALILCLTLFFVLVEISYTKAVFFITLFVIFAYDLINNQALEIVVPRMLYTLLGISTAWFVTFFLWPQWRKNLIPEQLKACLTSNQSYLKQCLQQTRDKAANNRSFQQTLHNHLQLVTYWQDMQQEPARKRGSMQHLFNLIQLNLECIIAARALIFMEHPHLPQAYDNINMFSKDNGADTATELPEHYVHLAHLVKKLSAQQYELEHTAC